jgi:hypothetical protein
MYKLNKDMFGNDCSVSKFEGNTHLCIPLNAPDNADYQQYLKWVAEGNTPEPADSE